MARDRLLESSRTEHIDNTSHDTGIAINADRSDEHDAPVNADARVRQLLDGPRLDIAGMEYPLQELSLRTDFEALPGPAAESDDAAEEEHELAVQVYSSNSL